MTYHLTQSDQADFCSRLYELFLIGNQEGDASSKNYLTPSLKSARAKSMLMTTRASQGPSTGSMVLEEMSAEKSTERPIALLPQNQMSGAAGPAESGFESASKLKRTNSKRKAKRSHKVPQVFQNCVFCGALYFGVSQAKPPNLG